MSHELIQKRIVFSVFPTAVEDAPAAGGYVDFNAASEKFTLSLPVPFDIYRFGLITATAMDPDAGGFEMQLHRRPTAGSDTNLVVVDSLRRADAQTVAAGKVLSRDVIVPVAQAVGSDGSLVNVGPTGPQRINPGEEAVLEVTNAVGAASTGIVWIEYAEHGFAQPSTVTGNAGFNVIKDLT